MRFPGTWAHRETERGRSRLQSEELSIHTWQTDSWFRSVRTCWYCTNAPASPTQSQELINDTSRNSVQKRTTDSSHLSLLNSARQSRVAEFGAVPQGYRQEATDPWEEYPRLRVPIFLLNAPLLSSNCGFLSLGTLICLDADFSMLEAEEDTKFKMAESNSRRLVWPLMPQWGRHSLSWETRWIWFLPIMDRK